MTQRLLRNLTCLLFLCAPILAFGQTARFTGQVTDPQGAAVPNADVQVINEETSSKFTTKTNENGAYTVPYLPAGHYQIVVTVPGFTTSLKGGITLGVGQAFVLNVQLVVEGSTSNVTVEGGASSVAQVNTENAEVSGTITGKEVSGIQLNGRNFSQLIALAPGVSNQTGQDEARVGMAGSVSYSVNGGRTEYNSFQVDGSETLNVGINKDHTSLIVTPSIDAIQEIKILTSNYGAQYPSTGDGSTIVTTKSGTDRYHGNLYEFVRNEMFNAKGYFDVTDGAPLYRRNDFGGTIGGPLSISHFYNSRGKTHFFFSEEARIEKDPYAYRQGVPSLAERAGNFSDVCPAAAPGQSTGFNPAQYPDCPRAQGSFGDFTAGTFSGNNLYAPTGGYVLNRNAVGILNSGVIPAPTATSGCASTIGSCYNAEVYLPTYYREELFRIDHQLTEKAQLGFRYIHDEWDETTPIPQYSYLTNNFPTIQNRFYGPGLSLVARSTYIFSPSLLNEFVASYTDSYLTLADIPGIGVNLQRPPALDAPCAFDPTALAGGYNVQQCGMGSIFPGNNNAGLNGIPKMPGIDVAGNNAEYGGNGFVVDPSYTPWEHSNPTYSFIDNVTKTWRKHNFSFGAQWIIFQRNQTNGPIGAATGETQGLLTFSNVKSAGTTGNSFADFLTHKSGSNGLGGFINYDDIASFQQDSAQGKYRQRYPILEPYLQDDWKITSRLTVNLGVRLSLFGTYYTANHNAYNFVPSLWNQAIANSVSVDPNQGELVDKLTELPIPLSAYNPSANLDPRLLNGFVRCGTNGVPASCMTGHLWNPAPRVGFAWDPFGNGKNAIRAGYGIFFEHGTADEANTGSLEGSGPMILDMTQYNPNSWHSIGTTGQGGENVAFPLNATSIPTHAVWPYVQQWSLSIERELPWNMLSTFAYVGSKGTHLTAEEQSNQLKPISSALNPYGPHDPFFTSDCGDAAVHNGNPVGNLAQVNLDAACNIDPNALRQAYPGMGQIFSLLNVATSNYNAFQATLRRVQGPLFLGVSYTYSHSLDSSSDRSDATFVNSFDLRANRASSNFDQRHLLHISYIYDLPLHRFLQRVLANINSDPDTDKHAANKPASSYLGSRTGRILADGWQLSGLTIYETGIPFTVVNNGSASGISTQDNAGVANGTGSGSYPDLSGISARSRRPAGGTNTESIGPLLLNPAAFVAPRGFTFGDSGRNSLNNPSRLNFDMALVKLFPVRESRSFEFRAEAFNVFNNTQFRIYDPVYGNQANNTVSCYGGYGTNYSAAGGEGTDCLTGSSFLHPYDAHRPRTLQLGLKYAF